MEPIEDGINLNDQEKQLIEQERKNAELYNNLSQQQNQYNTNKYYDNLVKNYMLNLHRYKSLYNNSDDVLYSPDQEVSNDGYVPGMRVDPVGSFGLFADDYAKAYNQAIMNYDTRRQDDFLNNPPTLWTSSKSDHHIFYPGPSEEELDFRDELKMLNPTSNSGYDEQIARERRNDIINANGDPKKLKNIADFNKDNFSEYRHRQGYRFDELGYPYFDKDLYANQDAQIQQNTKSVLDNINNISRQFIKSDIDSFFNSGIGREIDDFNDAARQYSEYGINIYDLYDMYPSLMNFMIDNNITEDEFKSYSMSNGWKNSIRENLRQAGISSAMKKDYKEHEEHVRRLLTKEELDEFGEFVLGFETLASSGLALGTPIGPAMQAVVFAPYTIESIDNITHGNGDMWDYVTVAAAAPALVRLKGFSKNIKNGAKAFVNEFKQGENIGSRIEEPKPTTSGVEQPISQQTTSATSRFKAKPWSKKQQIVDESLALAKQSEIESNFMREVGFDESGRIRKSFTGKSDPYLGDIEKGASRIKANKIRSALNKEGGTIDNAIQRVDNVASKYKEKLKENINKGYEELDKIDKEIKKIEEPNKDIGNPITGEDATNIESLRKRAEQIEKEINSTEAFLAKSNEPIVEGRFDNQFDEMVANVKKRIKLQGSSPKELRVSANKTLGDAVKKLKNGESIDDEKETLSLILNELFEKEPELFRKVNQFLVDSRVMKNNKWFYEKYKDPSVKKYFSNSLSTLMLGLLSAGGGYAVDDDVQKGIGFGVAGAAGLHTIFAKPYSNSYTLLLNLALLLGAGVNTIVKSKQNSDKRTKIENAAPGSDDFIQGKSYDLPPEIDTINIDNEINYDDFDSATVDQIRGVVTDMNRKNKTKNYLAQ